MVMDVTISDNFSLSVDIAGLTNNDVFGVTSTATLSQLTDVASLAQGIATGGSAGGLIAAQTIFADGILRLGAGGGFTGGIFDDFDIEIVEMHHKHKVDAPSGTAIGLGEAAARGRGVDLEAKAQRGRDGITGERRPGDIGFASLRGGDMVGEHLVIFAGAGERAGERHAEADLDWILGLDRRGDQGDRD